MMTSKPRFATKRTARPTYGHEVARLAVLLGFAPMSHQRLFWDVALEHERGVLAYREVIWTIPRQCGKSVAVFCLLLWRCLRWPAQICRYGAQAGVDARAMLCDTWWPRLEHSPLVELVTFRRQSGHEAILFENGSRLGLIASTEKSGHGSTLDCAVLDEAWAHPDHRLEQSTRPAMVTRANAQLFTVSTAGSESRSPFLWSKVETGRAAVEAGVTKGVAYLEYGAAEDADSADPVTWEKAIPALGTTIDMETVRGDFFGMPRREFERSMLNRWVATFGESIVSLTDWEALAEPAAPKPKTVILGVDVGPRSKSAAIAAAGPSRGLMYGSTLESGPGTSWVAPRLAELRTRLGAEVLADRRACSPIWQELESLDVVEIDGNGAAEACGYLLDLCSRKLLRHRGEGELARAIDGAGLRPLGDANAWSRKTSGCDITPLCALTAAAYGWRWEQWQ